MARINFDCDDDTHLGIRIAALRRGITMREWLLEAIERQFAAEEKAHKPPVKRKRPTT